MKKILMSMRTTETINYNEYRNSIAYEYVSFFEDLGNMIILVPNNSKNIENYFDTDVVMVVLSGGNNVNPKLYNSKDELDDVYIDRDDTERILLDLSFKNNIKVFAICRGFHFINVYFGGSLSHNIKNHVNKNHTLLLKNKILKDKKTNSFHNQAIVSKNLADVFNVLATSEDNIIEAIINKEKTILGVQWHPERQEKEFDKELIKKFIKGKI